jgi:hypothetical protein
MSISNMKGLLVLYLIPASVIAAWLETDASNRKAAEAKIRGEWEKWMADHGKIMQNNEAGGKTKRVSPG